MPRRTLPVVILALGVSACADAPTAPDPAALSPAPADAGALDPLARDLLETLPAASVARLLPAGAGAPWAPDPGTAPRILRALAADPGADPDVRVAADALLLLMPGARP